jgi:hypothetical protein
LYGKAFLSATREGDEGLELPDTLASALRSLSGAVDLLEAAAQRRLESDAARTDLETELVVMAEDRARLADELDRSLARADDLATVTKDVSRRLDQVCENIQVMLAPALPALPGPARV